MREDAKDLEKFELVYPAKDLLDATIASADALSQMPIDAERAKNLRLVLGFLNAYLKAFHEKMGYIKMVHVPEQVQKIIEQKMKKFK